MKGSGASTVPLRPAEILAADKAMYTRKISRTRLLAITNAGARPTNATEPDKISSGNLIVELDESHVLASRSIN